ncbi:MAG TPA: ribosome recycling factor [Candidatus Hydrogenedentes bacterium]|nr:ribosome recycling factor [Candidatus Hydrogenedentota bacterium]HPG68673.1 ribosome recycling factor [Candidatus Hydrogenedentota bacterium]
MAHAHVTEAKAKMERSLESFGQELSHIRTGRASTGMLDAIEVEAYGAKMKINQLANVTVPEPRLLVIAPWDKTQIPVIEKAILASNLDITPSNDGHLIRIPIPQLTEERRRDLAKVAAKLAEEARVAVRNVRRHQIEVVKAAQKDGDIPEDDAHRISDEIQKSTDEYCLKIDEALKAKEAEIMEV